ncbi:hypothetical protein E0Z10_g481 [Xylaria hypoxylon]|uniref:DUF4470 domain-containing protein n=1 Tax=Xylaria hypoxylon TaxID=37992 RepID=A0A4Z0Z9K6_9PEZI|nr:hypothetical protein E0Z10_g481 [Xylaria hypoxylon]
MNWSIHQVDCLDKMATATFETEHRLPSWAPETLCADLKKKHHGTKPQDVPRIGPQNYRDFIENNPGSGQFELFGSYPAIDVLRLAENEGVNRKKPIDVLFVEPTDLRDVIKTIVDLPDNAAAPIRVVITDGTTAKTTRNLILLLMALSSEDPDITAECAVSFWYSPFIPKWCLPAIREFVGRFVEDCDPKDEEEKEKFETGVARQWPFGSASLGVLLTQHTWVGLKAILNPCPTCWNNDHHEKTVMSFPPDWQAAKRRYMPSTQVTPFENHHSRANSPLDYNPSLFYGDFWPLKRDADPLRGWDLGTINENNDTNGADNDIYGKMFYYVRDLFKRFILKLRTANVTFHVLPYNGYDLAHGTELRFDRIETAALADEDLVGVRTVVDTLSPLLKAPWINPHATMITLHPTVFDKIRNAFPCPECGPDRAERIKEAVNLTAEEKALLDAYLPLEDPDPVNWIFTAAGWKRRDARWLFRNPTAAWELYKDIYDFHDVADGAKVAMRATHKVVDEWILRLKHADQLNEDGRPEAKARWDFDAVFATRQTSGYRYVEWRKLAAGERKKLAKKLKSAKEEPKRHEAYHEYLSDKGIAELEKKGSQLERWMEKDNCENWTPY